MGRVEVITGRERRRRWPEEEKLRILEEAMAPGVSMAEVARRHDLYPQQLYTWRRRVFAGAADRAEISGPMFLPVEIAETTAPRRRPRRRHAGMVEVVLANGRTLRIPPDIEPDALRCLVRALEEA